MKFKISSFHKKNNLFFPFFFFFLLNSIAFPATAAIHIGSHNPISEGWSVVSGDIGLSAEAVIGDPDFSEVYAWQINGGSNGRLRYQIDGPGINDSWIFSSQIRVANLNDALDFGILMEVANGVNRFILKFGSDSDGATLINLAGSSAPNITIMPEQIGQTDYLLVELVYNVDEGTADVFVNGQLKVSGYAGSPNTLSRVNFGDGATLAIGVARFAKVNFSTTLPSCRDGIDNDGDGKTDFDGGDEDCSSANDTTEGTFCQTGTDVDNDGICEQVFISHIGSINPGKEGWLVPTSAIGQKHEPGDNDLGAGNCTNPCPFWRVTDASTVIGSLGSYTAVFPYNTAGGWEFRSKIRVQPFTEGTAEGPNFSRTLLPRFPVSGGTQEYGLKFGITAAGDMQIQTQPTSGSSSTINIGSSYSYHDVRVVYNPIESNADVIVDGKLVIADYTGRFLNNLNIHAVLWGSAASGGTGRMHWHSIELELNPDTDNDGLSNIEELTNHSTDPFNVDSDGDQLNDGEEIAANTNPNKADTDNDGLTDHFELINQLNPLVGGEQNQDPDNDGLINLDEQKSQTLANNPDTDSDGIRDGDEVLLHGTNPLQEDSDNDGLTDGEEINVHGTDPLKTDTDGDGVFDGEELSEQNGFITNPLIADSDEDGLVDGIELLLSTNPLQADTDEDGLLDGFEVNFAFDPLLPGEQDQDSDEDNLTNIAEQNAGSNPLLPDSDNDGINDFDEVTVLGSNPSKKDSDDDGLLDGFEINFGFNPQLAGEQLLDTDNDGLTNLKEQEIGTDPLKADSDGDNFLDGEEVNLLGTPATQFNQPGLPLNLKQRLNFEATGQPLFTTQPDPVFIDILPLIDELEQTSFSTVSQGHVQTITQPVPLLAAQKVWDDAVAICDAKEFVIDTTVEYCRDLTVSPTRNECINGVNVSFTSRSIKCCASNITGVIDILDSISNGCEKVIFLGQNIGNFEKSFTIKDVNNLVGGPYVSPTFVNVGPGFPDRPSEAFPPSSKEYKIGALVSQNTSITGGFTYTPGFSSADPGSVDLFYDTDVSVSVDRSVVAPGEAFKLYLRHQPLPYLGNVFTGSDTSCSTVRGANSNLGSCLSSKWPDFDTNFKFGFDININASAEVWSINPNNGEQLHQTLTVYNKTISESRELVGFTAKVGEGLNFRFLSDLDGIPNFIKQDININNEIAGIDTGLFDVGAAFPVDINIPFGCFLKKIDPILCVHFGMPAESLFSTNLFSFRLQIPELNSPVSKADPDEVTSQGFNGGAPSNFSLEKIEPDRHTLRDGKLINTVPNKFRPTLNFSNLGGSDPGKSFLDTFVFNNTNLSSDTSRSELDLDGIVCISSGGGACLGATVGIPLVISISADLLDFDAVVWTGWDHSLEFDPKLKAIITFNKTVSVRLKEGEALQTVQANTPLVLDVIASPSQAISAIEVIQPVGGVDVSVNYSFANNLLSNKAQLNTKLAAEIAELQIELGGAVGTILSSAAGAPIRFSFLNFVAEIPPFLGDDIGGSYTMAGSVMEFPGPSFSVVDLNSDTDRDGVINEIENGSCTDALDADTDDDGLADGIEDINRNGVLDQGETDPCNADTDGDGLQDGTEKGLVTANVDTDLQIFVADNEPLTTTIATEADTDGDGLDDGEEILLYHTNPSKTDSDGDGNTDAEEVFAGSNPNNPLSNLSTLLQVKGDIKLKAGLNMVAVAINPNLVRNLANWVESSLGGEGLIVGVSKTIPASSQLVSCKYFSGILQGTACNMPIIPGEGLLINALSDEVINIDIKLDCLQRPLGPGINLVSFPCEESAYTAYDFLQSSINKPVTITTLDTTTGRWLTATLDENELPVGENFEINPLAAYIIYIADGTEPLALD